MLAEQFQTAAAGAHNSAVLDHVARLTWRAHGEGALSDLEASAVSEAIAARRKAFASGQGFRRPTSQTAATGLRCAARRPPRSPDRQASLERRRKQAMSGVVPAKIAVHFTPGELAVLTVIGRECQKRQVCVMAIDQISALAGVSRTTTQNALRAARRLGILHVKERRILGRKSLTNIVRIVSAEWRIWLERSGRSIGFKKLSPTDNRSSIQGSQAQISRHQTLLKSRRSLDWSGSGNRRFST